MQGKQKYLIVRMNSTSGSWIVERENCSTKYSLAHIDGRRWSSRENAGKAANKKNNREKMEKGGGKKWRKE